MNGRPRDVDQLIVKFPSEGVGMAARRVQEELLSSWTPGTEATLVKMQVDYQYHGTILNEYTFRIEGWRK